MPDELPRSPVTLDAVAIKAGMSRWTVAAALRGRGRVNPETAKRLRELADAMGYDPALTQAGHSLAEARHGRRTRHHLVALSLPVGFLDLPYYADLQRGVVRGLIAGGSAAVVTDFYRVELNHLDAARRSGTALLHGQVDAAIIYPFEVDAAHALVTGWRDGRFADRPVVTLMRSLPGLPAVLGDPLPALMQAVSELASHGHRLIAFAQWAEDPTEDPQWRAIRQRCLAAAGLDPRLMPEVLNLPIAWMDPRQAAHDPTEVTPSASESIHDAEFMRWLRAHPEVTALVLPNDAAALRVLAVVRRAGLQVPGDLSLVGGDGTDDFHDGRPGRFLASRKQPLERIGAAAARLALALVDGAASGTSSLPDESGPVEFLPAEYLAGRSVGVCKQSS